MTARTPRILSLSKVFLLLILPPTGLNLTLLLDMRTGQTNEEVRMPGPKMMAALSAAAMTVVFGYAAWVSRPGDTAAASPGEVNAVTRTLLEVEEDMGR
jgi:hypothetical protein